MHGEDGYIRLVNAYAYEGGITMTIVRDGHAEELTYESTDQFAAEIAYFSDCLVTERQPEPSGIDGLQDVRIIEAIYRSARDGRPVTLPRLARVDTTPVAEHDVRKLASDRRQAG
jgi:predicted dehydrogenase